MKKLLLTIGLGLLATSAYADTYDDVIKLTAVTATYHFRCENIENQYKERLMGFSTFIIFGDYDQKKAQQDLFAEVKKEKTKQDHLQNDYCETFKEFFVK